MIPEFRFLPKPRGSVADILEAKGHTVYAVAPGDTVYEAIVQMNAREVGALLVMDGQALVGIVSERDYTRKVAIQGRQSQQTRVQEIMTAQLHTVTPTTSLGECLHIVTRHKVRHLPVMLEQRVVGIVSIGDLVSAVLAQQAETIQKMGSLIGGQYPA